VGLDEVQQDEEGAMPAPKLTLCSPVVSRLLTGTRSGQISELMSQVEPLAVALIQVAPRLPVMPRLIGQQACCSTAASQIMATKTN
jgi:hypothetical protein